MLFSLIYVYRHTDIATVLTESCSSVYCRLVLVMTYLCIPHEEFKVSSWSVLLYILQR